MWLIYLVGGIWTFTVLAWAIARVMKIPVDIKEKNRIENLAKDIEEREKEAARKREHFETIKAESAVALERLSKEKSLGFPWLAAAYSEYHKLYDLKLAGELESKKLPAPRAAEAIRAMASEKAELRRENKVLRELHRYYESLFPWLIDFKGEDLDELIRQINRPVAGKDQNEDPADLWLSEAEQTSQTLTRAEKFQRALDRWWQTKKSPWQLGRDYERYIGYLHEREGFKVEYHGIEQGYEDMGRDLICFKDGDVRIVQCKYWRTQKTLHEKHVCQIFGTATAYRNKFGEQANLFDKAQVTAWLFVSCTASATAREFADMLRVNLMDNYPLRSYPIIKCNVSLRDGTKIYHLPFDQQYDRTMIEYKDECYVETVAQAEALGFRRAFRWRGNPQS